MTAFHIICSAIQDINHSMLLFIQVYATLESGMAPAMFVVFSVLIASGVEVAFSSVECQQDLSNGSSSSDCIFLGDALQTISSDTTLYLCPGTHLIDQFILIHGLKNVSIVGCGDGTEAVITCADSMGLVFVNITDLTIQNVRIEDCGLTGQNLTETLALLDGVIEIFFEVPSETTIAVFLGHVENLVMQNVTITNTSGLGLVGINVIGTSYISQVDLMFNIRPSNCSFFNGTSTLSSSILDEAGEMIGGGAYFLYQDYSPAYRPTYDNRQHSLNIDESKFIENSECSFLAYVEVSFMDSRVLQEAGYTVGGAGGLGLVLAQLHYGINITTNSALIQNNTAVFGSGVHVAIFSGVQDSHVVFSNCTFITNGIAGEESRYSLGGGGLGLVNDLIRPEGIDTSTSFRNRNLVVTISDSNFTENRVIAGAGAYILSEYTSPIRDSTDALMLIFNNCIFERNIALLGSALEITESKLSGREIGMQVFLHDVIVTSNGIDSINSDIAVSLSNSLAILEIRSVNVTISGNSCFSANSGTAVHARQGVVGITGNVTFDRNTGVYGGAMRLIRSSYLIVTSGARLYFKENIGRLQGGALYVDFPGGQSATFSIDDCFLYFGYNDFSVCSNCSNLNDTGVYIEFSDNIAPIGSIIYGSALQQCPWAVLLRQQYEGLTTFDIFDSYFPNVVNFTNHDPQGVENVITPPRELNIEDQQDVYFVVPGQQFNLSVYAIDNFIQNIPTVVSSYVSTDEQFFTQNVTASLVSSDGIRALSGENVTTVPVRIFGLENQTLRVVLFTAGLGGRIVQKQIDVALGSCGTGFDYSTETRTCSCNQLLMEANIQCDIANQTLIVPNDLWFGPVSSDGDDLAVVRCVETYCRRGTRRVSVRNGSVDYDVQCNPDLNRVGILCGSCPDGYSVVLGSDRCLRCSNGYIALFLVFALLGVLLIVTMTTLRITITAGYLNGALFYANIVSLYGRILVPTTTTGGNYIFASFLTLNLGIETCLHSGMTSLERVWWQLSFPLYLFILMFSTELIFRIFSKCFKFDRSAGLSTIQAFATLVIVCYVSVLESCVELLGAVNISTLTGERYLRWRVDPSVPYFQNAHGFLAFIACILVVFYIIPLPLFLLFPSLVFRTKYLNRFKPFYDVFWHPFEPLFRFWLGLRLIFRWIPFALVYFLDSPENTFITNIFLLVLIFFQLILRPFVGKWRNVLDGYFLLNLLILFSGSLYFNARAELNSGNMRQQILEQQTIFSTVFISIFGYLGFAVVFVYHIFERFPKLKKSLLDLFLKLKNVLRKGKESEYNAETVPPPNVGNVNETLPPDELSTGAEHSTGQNKPPHVVTVTELREPLLEWEGTVEVVSAPPIVVTEA